MNKDSLAMTHSMKKNCLNKPALEAVLPFRHGALTVVQVLGSKAGRLLRPQVISWRGPSPHCTSLSELVQVRPTQHHKTHCKHILITYLWYLSAYAFSKASHKPLHKHNQNVTGRRGQLFHWDVELYSRNKQTSHRYLGVHCLRANLGQKLRTLIYNSPREIQIANQLTCCFV